MKMDRNNSYLSNSLLQIIYNREVIQNWEMAKTLFLEIEYLQPNKTWLIKSNKIKFRIKDN